MSERHLRDATNEPAPVREPETVVEAADASERALLVALRRYLAREMDAGKVPAHALASVSAKIREYDREIRALDAREEQEAEKSQGGRAVAVVFDAAAI